MSGGKGIGASRMSDRGAGDRATGHGAPPPKPTSAHAARSGRGAGTSSTKASRPVVLYHATVRTHTDSKGRVTQRIRLVYYPLKTVRATLVVTVRTPLGASTRRTRVTITPVHHRFR